MKKGLFTLLLSATIFVLPACNNGNGEECICDHQGGGIASETVKGGTEPCDEYRLKGSCFHTRECEDEKK